MPSESKSGAKTRPSCKDCGSTTRKLTRPGPRCATCRRARQKATRSRAHGSMVEKTYGITADEYRRLHGSQGGLCAICRRATGATRRLAVDHDHRTGEVRGLLCKSCNRYILGYARDEVAFFVRAIEYLLNPPARRCFGGSRYVPGTENGAQD